MEHRTRAAAVAAGLALAALARVLCAADRPQWGQRFSRNMVADETGLPVKVDIETGLNVRWAADLGAMTYGTPVVARGRVFVGTNNWRPREARRSGDRGVLMCLEEAGGGFLWQLAVPKLRDPTAADAWGHGFFAPPTVEGDLAYVVTNRCEVVCLDLDGMADGNDGPFLDEAEYLLRQGEVSKPGRWERIKRWFAGEDPPPPAEALATDADILWRFDMIAEVGVRPQDASNCSVLIRGDFLYVCTSNGTDASQKRVPRPAAPAVVALDKRRGALAARDAFGIGTDIVHGQWSSPSLGRVGDRTLLVFGGGNGVCYAFEPLEPGDYSSGPENLHPVWSFDCDPGGHSASPGEHLNRADPEGPSSIIGSPVFHDGRVYVAAGGDPWHGKRQSWLKCIDPAAGEGDVTGAAEIWSYEMPAACITTPSIARGLVTIADCGGGIHCLDAATGRPLWTHKVRGAIWASTLIADGKVYVGTRRGELLVFAAARTKRLLARVKLDSAITASPVAANGVLYVATHKRLYAFARDDR